MREGPLVTTREAALACAYPRQVARALRPFYGSSTLSASETIGRIDRLRWWRERDGLVGRLRGSRLKVGKPYRAGPFQIRPLLKARVHTSTGEVLVVGRLRPAWPSLFPFALPPVLVGLLIDAPSENRPALGGVLAVSLLVIGVAWRPVLRDYLEDADDLEGLVRDRFRLAEQPRR